MFNALIIDDDPIQLRIAELLLKKSDAFKSTTFLSAGLALDYIRHNQQNASFLPDVIFLDLNMPKLDGWEFLNLYGQLLPTICKSIRVFIVSSSIDQRDHKKSVEYSFVNGFISKPITPETVSEIIDNVASEVISN